MKLHLTSALGKLVRDEKYRPLIFLIASLVAGESISSSFLTTENMRSLAISSAPLVVMTIGEILVMMTGMIDLGVESVAAASSMLVAYLMLYTTLPILVIIVIVLGLGLAVGLFDGFMVTKFRMPSFLVTLGIYWGMKGLALIIGNGATLSPGSVFPAKPFGIVSLNGSIGSVPVLFVVGVVLTIFFQIVISKTIMGRHILAVGGNELGAKELGVNNVRIKYIVFIASGMLSSFAGIMLTAWLNSAYPLVASGWSLESIAGAILGGVAFSGGVGSIVGGFVGAFIVNMLTDIIVLAHISALYSYVVVAVILILAGLQLKRGEIAK